MRYKIQLAPSVAQSFTTLHPEIRQQLKSGLQELAKAPYSGKILQDELSDFSTYKIKRYRIIYKVSEKQQIIKIFMIGHRKGIYDLLTQLVRNNH